MYLEKLIRFTSTCNVEVALSFSKYLNHYQLKIRDPFSVQTYSIRDGSFLQAVFGSASTVEDSARDLLEKIEGKRLTLSKDQKTGKIKELPIVIII